MPPPLELEAPSEANNTSETVGRSLHRNKLDLGVQTESLSQVTIRVVPIKIHTSTISGLNLMTETAVGFKGSLCVTRRLMSLLS